MMFKALAALTLVLVAVDYAMTGGSYSSALFRDVVRFFRWVIESGHNSIFSQ